MTDVLDELEEVMQGQQLYFPPPTWESDQFKLPRMVTIYKKTCRIQLWGLCTQEQFMEAVVAACPEYDANGVRARASRAYPAFVRQHHLLAALISRTQLEGVHWIPELDFRGVDLLVLDDGRALGVALSLVTDAARSWQRVKNRRHPPLAGLRMLRLELDEADADRIGPFWVHPPRDVQRVVAEMAVRLGVLEG